MSSTDGGAVDKLAAVDNDVQRRIRSKLDWRILPILTLLFLSNTLDRNNIGNAKIAGLPKDLHLRGNQYNIGLSLFYVMYVLFPFPSNWVLKRVGAHRWIPFLAVGWSIITIATGFIQSFGGLIAVRMVLSIFETGMLPGVAFYLSTVYTRHELQTRIALFWAPAMLAGAFGGLLASGIIHMDGVGGLSGWRWIFILEGIVSFLIGLLAFFVIPKDINSMRFLTPDEKSIAIARIRDDMACCDKYSETLTATSSTDKSIEDIKEGTAGSLPNSELDLTVIQRKETFEWYEIRRGLMDIRSWITALAFFGIYAALLSNFYFIPTIINGLGYSGSEAQLRTVPPFVVASAATVGTSLFSDRYKCRLYTTLALVTIAIIGYAVIITAKNNNVRYGALFIIFLGVVPTAPCFLAIIPNNTSGHYKRATCIALIIGVCSTAGFLSTFIYTPDQAPTYVKGHKMVLGLLCSSWALTAINIVYCLWENKARADGRRDGNVAAYRALVEAGVTRAPIGDRHPDFRYTL